MKLNKNLIFLCMLAIILNNLNCIKNKKNKITKRLTYTNSNSHMLTNEFKISLKNNMQQSIFDRLKLNNDFMESIENKINPKEIKDTIGKISEIFARKITKKKIIKNIIKTPNRPIKKIVNLQNQISKVMTRALQSKKISEILFDNSADKLLRTKILKAIILAFEQIYLQQSTPVLNVIRNSIITVHENDRRRRK